MNQEERMDIYTIPPNFAEEGTLLSGRIKTRNALETAMVLMALLPLLLSLDVSLKTKMYLGMAELVPVIMIGIIGIQGESLFAFVAGFFRYLKRRRCLTAPDERYRLEQNRRKAGAGRGGERHGRRHGQRRTEKGKQSKTECKPDMEEGIKKD